MRTFFISLLMTLALLPGHALAQTAGDVRPIVALDKGWRFSLGDAGPAAIGATYNDQAWQTVTVPHTWNRIGGYVDKPAGYNIQRSPGWYRLQVTPPPSFAGKRVFVEFGAALTVADVWMNDVYLGRHAGGFSTFRFDVTAALKANGPNLLVVKADNSVAAPGQATEDIPPLSGDFFPFGGLYRAVKLIATDPVHIDMLDYGGPGVYAHTVSVDGASAKIAVLSRLANDTAGPVQTRVRYQILDDKGRAVATAEDTVSLAANGRAEHKASLTVPNPRLWNGRADPYLYRIAAEVRAADGRVLDRVVEPLGIRTFRIDSREGFFLNGKRLDLNGVSRHQDRPDKGWAISDDDAREDMKIIEELGATTVRFAHYNHARIWSQLSDEAGMVAWAEIPIVNQIGPPDADKVSPIFEANARQQLLELIRQNYNHPSIVVWSIANEVTVGWSGTGNEKGGRSVRPLLTALDKLANEEDPSRLTTIALCCELAAFERNGVRDYAAGTADTAGWNLYFGWYRGKVTDMGPFLQKAHDSEPDLPLSLAEFGAGGGLTQHADHPEGGPINVYGRPHPEEFMTWWHEKSWPQIKDQKFLWGRWIWNMFDFTSNIRAEGDLLDTNDKGLVSFDRKTRKDAFYYYKAQWNPEPMLHLTERRYVDRAYPVMDIRAYSTAPNATLTLNGRKIATAACPEKICVWPRVRLTPGENHAVVTAAVGGKKLRDETRWTFSGNPRVMNIRAGTLTPYVAPDGTRYGTDNFFVGGTGRELNRPPRGDAAPSPTAKSVTVVDPGDKPFYQNWREGTFSYALPLPDGRYLVTLRFFEPSETKAGARVFTVAANGKTVLPDFDIFAASTGTLKPVAVTVQAEAKDGLLKLDFTPSAGQAVVSTISVKQQE